VSRIARKVGAKGSPPSGPPFVGHCYHSHSACSHYLDAGSSLVWPRLRWPCGACFRGDTTGSLLHATNERTNTLATDLFRRARMRYAKAQASVSEPRSL
jgi:hypothetical protein